LLYTRIEEALLLTENPQFRRRKKKIRGRGRGIPLKATFLNA